MKRQVLFIQGAGEGAYEADDALVASLRQSLGAGYEVLYPRMPENAPDYEAWKQCLGRVLDMLDGEIVLVGHSVGGYVLARYLGEETGYPRPILGVFLIAPPYPGGDDNWVYDGFTLPENLAAKFPEEAAVFLYHSPDDQPVPFAHVHLYAKEFPAATMRETRGGHQLHDDLSVVAQDIASL